MYSGNGSYNSTPLLRFRPGNLSSKLILTWSYLAPIRKTKHTFIQTLYCNDLTQSNTFQKSLIHSTSRLVFFNHMVLTMVIISFKTHLLWLKYHLTNFITITLHSYLLHYNFLIKDYVSLKKILHHLTLYKSNIN